MQFTEEQLKWFRAYKKVQEIGQWNMADPIARRATGLTSEQCSFVMQNYSALLEASRVASETPKTTS